MTKRTKKKESRDRRIQLEQLKRLGEANEQIKSYDRALMFAQGLISLSTSINKKMDGYFLQALCYIGLEQYEKAIHICNYNMMNSFKFFYRPFALLRESAKARKKLSSLRQKQQQKKKSNDFVISFPLEIIYQIFSWVDFQTFIFCCTQVNIMWNSILTGDYIWNKMMNWYRTISMTFKVLTDQDQNMLKNELQRRKYYDDDDDQVIKEIRFSITISSDCQRAVELIKFGSCGVHSFVFEQYDCSVYGEIMMNQLIVLNAKTLKAIYIRISEEAIGLSTLLKRITYTKITRLDLDVPASILSWSFLPKEPAEYFQLPCLIDIIINNFYTSHFTVVYDDHDAYNAITYDIEKEGEENLLSTSEYQYSIIYRYIKFFCSHCPRLQSLTITFPGRVPCDRIMGSYLTKDIEMPSSLRMLIF